MTDRIQFSSAGAPRKREKADESTIRGATIERCIEEQEAARYHHDEAWLRLSRLIGST